MRLNKSFYAKLSLFKKREVRYVQPYYYQGGAWHKQEELSKEENSNGNRGLLSRLFEGIRRALAKLS